MSDFRTVPQKVLRWLQGEGESTYWLTRWMTGRALAFIYVVAFCVVVFQAVPLIGEQGLYPVGVYLERSSTSFWEQPSLFWFHFSDTALQVVGAFGLGVALVAFTGRANALVWCILYVLYLSVVNVGQVFYGYGWESQLLEVGFLVVFLYPLWGSDEFDPGHPPPLPIIWLLRWHVFRVMLGSGLIKIRGDECWTDLTCLYHHFETQPIPNPVSWYFHHLPEWLLQGGVMFNHFVELVVPFGVFGPRRVRHASGLCIIAFQGTLIVSGNLSFLNWLTIAAALACFDDSFFRKWLPDRVSNRVPDAGGVEIGLGRRGFIWGVFLVIALLSYQPLVNMLSPKQTMNRAYDPLHIINTYGAFGSVGKERREIVIKGTRDRTVDNDTKWKEYVFPCKPGPVDRRPCLITPYHQRFDWQLWFAPMSSPKRNPWLLHFSYKLLEGEDAIEPLIEKNPFPEKPPRYVKIDLYKYEFVESSSSSDWWRREKLGEYLPPVSVDHRGLNTYLRRVGLLEN